MTRRLMLFALFAALAVWPALAPAQELPAAPGAEPKRNLFQEWRDKLNKPKEPPPVDELFKQAEENYNGRETVWGKLVRKTAGEDSKLYKKGWLIKRKNETRALEQYQQIVDNYPFSKHAAIAQLRVADCNYALENWEEARINYELFLKLYPKSPEVPGAMLRLGNCHYEQMQKPGRDQDQTNQAVLTYTDLLARFPEAPEAAEAKTKLTECRTLQARHELIVADFYFKRKDYWAAAARYRGVWQVFSGLGFDARSQFMEGSCYESLGKTDRATELYNQASAQTDDPDYVGKAKARIEALRGTAP